MGGKIYRPYSWSTNSEDRTKLKQLVEHIGKIHNSGRERQIENDTNVRGGKLYISIMCPIRGFLQYKM